MGDRSPVAVTHSFEEDLSMLNVGDKIPTVTLEGTRGGETVQVQLGARPGRYRVLVFYPFAFTPV